MNFRDWYYSYRPKDRPALAARLGTSRGYLDMIAGGFRKPGETLALRIELESDGAVPVEISRPDVPWHVIRAPKIAAAENIRGEHGSASCAHQ